MATVEALAALARRAQGKRFASAIPTLDELDWGGYYPVVDDDGVLTGEVVESSDPGYVIVDCQDNAPPIHRDSATDAALSITNDHDCESDCYDD